MQTNLSKCIKMFRTQPNFQFILFQGMTYIEKNNPVSIVFLL